MARRIEVPAFLYLAVDGRGQEIRGVIEAPDPQSASQRLAEGELLPLEIQPRRQRTGIFDALRQRLPVSVEDLSLFSNQFALMLDTGLPILSALDLLAENSTKLKLRRALERATHQIREGQALHEALAAGGQFPSIYLNMIRAAEQSGTLVDVLKHLASYLDREAELRGRIRGALAYPLFLVLLASAVVIFLMVAIIPKFTQVLSDLGVALPLPTRLLIGLSAALVDLWPWILGGMGGVVVAIVLTFRRESARLRLDILLLKLPVVGELLAKNGLARLAYVLGALLRGGIPIVDALDVAARTAGNRSLGAAIVRARREILAGKGISEALATDGAMPALVLQMIAIGEATGNLDEVLVRIAELYDQQVARVTDVLVRLIEPALIVVLGVVVGFIALSLVLPMVRAVASMGG